MTEPQERRNDVFFEALSEFGPAWLPRQRWFGDKSRAIASVSVEDATFARVAGLPVGLIVAGVGFTDEGSAAYFIPLTFGDDATPALHRLRDETAEGIRPVIDAMAAPAVRDWLLTSLVNGVQLTGEHGTFTWRAVAGESASLSQSGTSRLSTAEQSNSAIVFGQSLLLKVFRKLQEGLNPDIEVGRFLTERTSFRNLPPLLGDLTYQPHDRSRVEISLAMAQPFIVSLGDGWSVMLDRLTAAATGGDDRPAMELADRLGRRTAQLHLALASDPTEAAFAPEAIANDDVRRWSADLTASLARSIADVHRQADRVPIDLRDAVRRLSPDHPQLAASRDGFGQLVGAAKTRVHGDYHLGQTLVTPDGDVIILDFEGEPARPLAERRMKTSPLKDVAGMLRSFGYARHAVAKATPEFEPGSEPDSRLARWEAAARSAFLRAYLAECRPRNAAFLPSSDSALAAALAAWELDKAVYEVNYELNNRPDWLDLPLRTLAGR